MSDDKAPREKLPTFPTFCSLAEAEAYSDQTGDPYFEICYHLEGRLNVALKTMHDHYAEGSPSKRAKMQTGLVRGLACPEGWPKRPKPLISLLVALTRYRLEETAHAYTVREALTALVFEKEHEGTMSDSAFDSGTFEPDTPVDAENARKDLLRLCDWIESRLHMGVHSMWYRAPDCFVSDEDRAHLANIGVTQRHLANLPERDRKRWEGIHARAAEKHWGDLKTWSVVGKVQHDPEPRTWTHPETDGRIIGLWPLVVRYNWTYVDLLNVLERLLPLPSGEGERRYPLDSTESLKVHCRTICGLTKSGKGRSAREMPEGWPIAERLFGVMGK